MADGSERRARHRADISTERLVAQRDKARREHDATLHELEGLLELHHLGINSADQTIAALGSWLLGTRRQ